MNNIPACVMKNYIQRNNDYKYNHKSNICFKICHISICACSPCNVFDIIEYLIIYFTYIIRLSNFKVNIFD